MVGGRSTKVCGCSANDSDVPNGFCPISHLRNRNSIRTVPNYSGERGKFFPFSHFSEHALGEIDC
jgi:hypothetical protein